MMFAEKNSETLREMRQTNCNACGKGIPKNSARKKAKGEGDLLIWCADCYKKNFRKKVKLLKRMGE